MKKLELKQEVIRKLIPEKSEASLKMSATPCFITAPHTMCM